MTVLQEIVTIAAFAVATVAIGYGSTRLAQIWKAKRRSKSFDAHVIEALSISKSQRRHEMQQLWEMWNRPAATPEPGRTDS